VGQGSKNSLPSSLLVVIAALCILAKIISNQNLFLGLFLIVCCYGIYKEKTEGKIVFLLFFTSWMYVLKVDADSFSLFHVVQLFYMLSCVLSILKDKSKISLNVIFGFILFALYIGMNSSFNQNNNQMTVVGFLLNFLTIALAIATLKKNPPYERYVLFYASGLFCSGLVALLGNWVPQVEKYTQNMGEKYTLYEKSNLYTRFSGLDMDPNYFSLQVLVAISLLLVVSGYKKNRLKESALIVGLTLMGLTTLSKMFLLLLIFIAIYTCAVYIRGRFIRTIKYIFLIIAVILSLIPLGLLDFISVTVSRFSEHGNSAVTVTTGRTYLWLVYIEEIIANPRVFLIGNGIGSGFLNGHAAHNMYLSYWYFMGLIGIVVLIVFVIILYNQIKRTSESYIQMANGGLNKLPLLVVLTANLSLDSIVMDFFPLLLFLSLLSVNYVYGYEKEVEC